MTRHGELVQRHGRQVVQRRLVPQRVGGDQPAGKQRDAHLRATQQLERAEQVARREALALHDEDADHDEHDARRGPGRHTLVEQYHREDRDQRRTQPARDGVHRGEVADLVAARQRQAVDAVQQRGDQPEARARPVDAVDVGEDGCGDEEQRERDGAERADERHLVGAALEQQVPARVAASRREHQGERSGAHTWRPA